MRLVSVLLAAGLLALAGCAGSGAAPSGPSSSGSGHPSGSPSGGQNGTAGGKGVAVKESYDLVMGVHKSWDVEVGKGLKSGHFTFTVHGTDPQPEYATNNLCVSWTLSDAKGNPLDGGEKGSCGSTVGGSAGAAPSPVLSIGGSAIKVGAYHFDLSSAQSLGTIDVDLLTAY